MNRSPIAVVGRGVTAALALAVLLAGCGRGRGEPSVGEAGPYRVAATLAPDPPRQRGNTLRLEVAGADGRPLEGAQLGLDWSMPAMGAMPEMRGRADVVERGGGAYEARFDLPAVGSWSLELTVRGPAGAASLDYGLTVGRRGLTVSDEAASGVALPAQRFDEATLAELAAGLDAYEEVRAALAADDLVPVGEAAGRLASALERAATGADGLATEVAAVLAEAQRVADALAHAPTLVAARAAFGEASRMLMLLANCDPRLGEGWHAFSCPMTKGFPKWIQPQATLANPYMGQAMSTCGSPADWSVPPLAGGAEVAAHGEYAHAAGEEVAYWTCSMHTSVRASQPGSCPICSMDLVPVTASEATTGVIRIDARRRQAIGVTTDAVRRQPLTRSLRAVGKVMYDETRLADVTVKYPGWIGTLEADATGERVRRGQVLFTLYSPQVYAAQQELLTALASQRTAQGTSAPDRVDALVEAARRRLRLWDLTPAQIDGLEASGEPIEYLPYLSPVAGFIVEKNVVAGSAVEPGMRLYRLAGLDAVWIEAEVYESELALLAVGDAATVTFPYLPARVFTGRVALVYPYLDGASRTGRVRVELPNPELDLKPDMYAEVAFVEELGERLAVPEEAILYAGERRFVFVDLGEGRLRPQRVVVGQRAGDLVEIVEGLEEGEIVVTSGNFLVAAEARLKLDMEHWR